MNTESRPGVLMVAPYAKPAIEMLSKTYEIHRLWEAPDRASFLAERAGRIRAIATVPTLGADSALIAALPRLEIICCCGVGTDAIDFVAARKRGIPVTITPDVLTGEVADLVVGMTLAITRRMLSADAFIRSGTWAKRGVDLSTRFYGKRVGIAGFGRIGKMVAQRLSGFETEIGYTDLAATPQSPLTYFTSLEALAEWSDVLIAAMSGGPATEKIVNAAVLKALGPQGYFVNVARGSVVDEPALLDALEQRNIAGAALDVFWNEPKINPRFSTLENVVLQPHYGSATAETRQAMAELVRDNLIAHFAGRPLPTPAP